MTNDRCFDEGCPHYGTPHSHPFKNPTDAAVNHPAHYGGDTTYEVIKVLKAWLTRDEYIGFLKGNVIKYNARARHKAGAEDYAKAAWYQRELESYTRESP